MKIAEILQLEDKKSYIEVRPSNYADDYIDIICENPEYKLKIKLSKTEAILLADCLNRKIGVIK